MKREYKRIYCCGDCINYDWKKHRCKLGANKEESARDKFYSDCTLPSYYEDEGEQMVYPEGTVKSVSIVDDDGNLKYIPLDRVIIERR